MIKFLIEKEFKQLLRNSFLPRLILIFPCMIMLLMPWAVNLEIKNIQPEYCRQRSFGDFSAAGE